MSKDDLGDRMKSYEKVETSRKLDVMLPIYARIDGRGFSRFTKGMNRPFDEHMSNAMIETTRFLVKHTNAKIGYCQSDEISLLFLSDTLESDIFFSGKIQKLVSILASLSTVAFNMEIRNSSLAEYSSRMPHFDARVFQLPSKTEAVNALIWRQLDATKNAISMAARKYYSAKELHGKNSLDMKEMLKNKNINFDEYPEFFKYGTFLQRRLYPRPDLGENVKRSSIDIIDIPRLASVINREQVCFNGDIPIK